MIKGNYKEDYNSTLWPIECAYRGEEKVLCDSQISSLGDLIDDRAINRDRSNISLKVTVSRQTFCLDDLSIDVSGVVQSATIIMLLSISPFGSINNCFLYFDAPMLGASILITVTTS